MTELSNSAISGGKKLLAYFIDAARTAERSFVAGPVWNSSDVLVPGVAQRLRYALANEDSMEVGISTADLEQYDAKDAAVVSRLHEEIATLLVSTERESRWVDGTR